MHFYIGSRATIRFAVLIFATMFVNVTPAAEEDTLVLTITGDLIGKIEPPHRGAPASTVIDTYYSLLADGTQEQIASLRQALAARIPDYQVAYRAADTAELNEVADDISLHWAAIRSIHAAEFTTEVVEILRAAYAELYDILSLD